MKGRELMMLRNVKMTNNLRKILNPIMKNTVKVTNSLRKKIIESYNEKYCETQRVSINP